MWPMIAGPGLRCGECRHNILPGRLCLSELPEEMPPGVSRSDFRNYCIGCPECWRRGMHACYVRYLEGGNSQGRTDRSLPCSRCGRRIPSGDRAGIETHYDWPSALDDRDGLTGRATARTSTAGTVGMAAGREVLVRGMPSGSFADLSDSLQQKQIINKLREAEVAISAGSTVAEVSRQIGVTQQTFYRWRTEYGGLKIDQARRLKQLETENGRLRRAVADLTLDNQILREAAEGNF